MLAKMKYQLEYRIKSGLISKKDKPPWRYKLQGLWRPFALRSGSHTSPQPARDNHHRRTPQQQFKHIPTNTPSVDFPKDDLAQLQKDRAHLCHIHVLICSCWLGSLLSPPSRPNESTISTWVSWLPLVLVPSPCRGKIPLSPSADHRSVLDVLWCQSMVVCSRMGNDGGGVIGKCQQNSNAVI